MPELCLPLNATQHRLLREAATTVGTSVEMFALDAATYEADRILRASPWTTTASEPASDAAAPPIFTVTAVER